MALEGTEIDGWSQDGNTCIIYGKGYRVTPTGGTVCIGPVDRQGQPITEKPAAAVDTALADMAHAASELISKPHAGENIPVGVKPAEVLKQTNRGGRPRNPAGHGSRSTLWRQARLFN